MSALFQEPVDSPLVDKPPDMALHIVEQKPWVLSYLLEVMFKVLPATAAEEQL